MPPDIQTLRQIDRDPFSKSIMDETVGCSVENVIYVLGALVPIEDMRPRLRSSILSQYGIYLMTLSTCFYRVNSKNLMKPTNMRYQTHCYSNMKNVKNINTLHKCKYSLSSLTFIFLTSPSLQSYYCTSEIETDAKSMSVLSNPPFILELYKFTKCIF